MIRLDERLSVREQLEFLTHEMLHAAGWHIDEGFVAQFAEDVAREAARLGLIKED